ncbi:MAG: hypothetical protein K0R10_2979 [Alphaproteobacteria bacterium]|jgi:hypothetical protein|nr:hypothetical protein [Alphaproteobacteria bacterium]
MKLAAKKCLACTGGGFGGLLAGHAGCLAATLLAGIGVSVGTGAAVAMPLSMFIFGALTTTAALALWFRLRGPAASLREKQSVVACAVLGLLISIALHHPTTADAEAITFSPFDAFCGQLPR